MSTTAELDFVETDLRVAEPVAPERTGPRHAAPSRGHRHPSARDRAGHRRAPESKQPLTMFALAALTVTGAGIRAYGFSNQGLFRDDAWVVLSAKVGLGTAWHMWVTAPGFYLLERSFILMGPGTTSWDQLPVFVVAVACIPAVYALIRYFGLGRVAGLAASLLVSVSPVCVACATRLKEYPFDFLLVCVLLMLAEAVRRNPRPARVVGFAAFSVAAFAVSASEGPVLAALWLAILVLTARARPYPWRVVVGAGATAAGCFLVASIFYMQLSPAPTRYWVLNHGFIEHHSLGNVVSTTNTTAWHLLSGLFGFPAFGLGLRMAVVLAWLALSIFALVRKPSAMLGPGLVVAAGFAASAAHVAPLGTGRTDEYIYPALLLLLSAGATEAVALGLRPRPAPVEGRHRSWVRLAAATAIGVAALAGSVALFARASQDRPSYTAVDVAALAGAIKAHEQPGDHIFVSELMRYPWALYEDSRLHLEFGSAWATGFTVVSTDPDTFIAPSEDYEGGSDPAAWAVDMAPYHRLWYVWFPPLGSAAPSYKALLQQGWRPSGTTLAESGCSATLLVRS